MTATLLPDPLLGPEGEEVSIGSMCTGYAGLDMGVAAALGGSARLAWVADNDPHVTRLLPPRSSVRTPATRRRHCVRRAAVRVRMGRLRSRRPPMGNGVRADGTTADRARHPRTAPAGCRHGQVEDGPPGGWVTDPDLGLRRTAQLQILGNGVVPQQAAHAVRHLLAECTGGGG